MNTILFLTLIGVVGAQTNLALLANGSLPDGSRATASGLGSGSSVTGTATIGLNQTVSSSSVVLSAVGSFSSPSPSPSPIIEVTTVSQKAKPSVQVQSEATPISTCKDVVNTFCPNIAKYENCGFCVVSAYPTVGKGCEYTKEMVKKYGDKKKSEYEVVISPKCECDGTFILNAESCPTCETALAALLQCAQAVAQEVVEIPAKCLTEVGVTVEYLKQCGFVQEKAQVEQAEVKPAGKNYASPEATPVPSPVAGKKYAASPEATPVPSPVAKRYIVVEPEVASASSPKTKKYTVASQPETVPVPAPKTKTPKATATASASASVTIGH
eukprot:TRINITY_DN2154_c0_g1_i10.p2 TRINITY_DN2154_c0_g1~~TRINITY_DN2154_c0_g1_i10.p2  ORF type:complete len:327 (-),score=62.49 TRINITY_DN2154_c0_g1_i10:194-1174(-)